MTGYVKTLTERGFLFAIGQDGISYFVHRSAFADEQVFRGLREDDQVELLELENTDKGWRANRVAPAPQQTQTA